MIYERIAIVIASFLLGWVLGRKAFTKSLYETVLMGLAEHTERRPKHR